MFEADGLKPELKTAEARVSYLPVCTGDGYGWGGGVFVTIGHVAISLGEGAVADDMAKELARRWNVCR